MFATPTAAEWWPRRTTPAPTVQYITVQHRYMLQPWVGSPCPTAHSHSPRCQSSYHVGRVPNSQHLSTRNQHGCDVGRVALAAGQMRYLKRYLRPLPIFVFYSFAIQYRAGGLSHRMGSPSTYSIAVVTQGPAAS